MADPIFTIDTYLSAYNEQDHGRRLELVQTAFAPSGRLIDPPLDGEGHEGVCQMMGAVHQQFPGHTFRRTSGVDHHHDAARYGWELLDPAGNVALAGMDVAEMDSQGRLLRVTGFFGPLPTDE